MVRLYKSMSVIILVMAVAQPAMANNFFPMPQVLKDLLLPKPTQAALPPANTVQVDVPYQRVVPPAKRSDDVIRLAPGQPTTLNLSRDAASIIVANPTHASIYLDNPRTVVIVPRAPGATHFSIADKNGDVILNQPIVVDEKENASYVRVTRMCGNSTSGGNCQPATTYYCADNCVAVSIPVAQASTPLATIPPVSAMPPLPATEADLNHPPTPPTAAEGVN